MGETTIARRLLLHFRRQLIVGLARELRRLGGIGLNLHTRAGYGEHGDVDTRLIHRRETLLAEIAEPRQKLFATRVRNRRHGGDKIRQQARRNEVLLESDLVHGQPGLESAKVPDAERRL